MSSLDPDPASQGQKPGDETWARCELICESLTMAGGAGEGTQKSHMGDQSAQEGCYFQGNEQGRAVGAVRSPLQCPQARVLICCAVAAGFTWEPGSSQSQNPSSARRSHTYSRTFPSLSKYLQTFYQVPGARAGDHHPLRWRLLFWRVRGKRAGTAAGRLMPVEGAGTAVRRRRGRAR